MKASITINFLTVLYSRCNNMNSATCSVVRTAIAMGIDVYGFYKGHSGLVERKNEPTGAQLEFIRAMPFNQPQR